MLHHKTPRVNGFVIYGDSVGLANGDTLPDHEGMLSGRQKRVVWGWIAAICLLGLLPPWISAYGHPAGYWPLFLSPPYWIAKHPPVGVDTLRLVIEWVLATVIFGGLYFAWPGKAR